MSPIHRRKGAEEPGARNHGVANFGADSGNAEDEEARLGHARPASPHYQTRRACVVAMLAVYGVLYLVSYGPFRSQTEKVEWEDFALDYQKRYKRPPPLSLKQWLDFAVSNDCDTMKYYNAIERDLAVFRKRPKESFRYDEVAEPLQKYSGYNVVIRIKDNTLTFVEWKIPFEMTWTKKQEHFYLKLALRWLFSPITYHMPPIDTLFVYNLKDEPTEVENAAFPIFSSCHVSFENDHLVYDNRTVTRTAFLPTDTNVTRDVLLPYYFSIGPIARGFWFWPLYTSGPSWDQRENVITWRGSTTGIWEASPRFWLTSRNHTMNGSVTADFGFVRVVQNNGKPLPEKYRQAELMTYRDIQKHKYVLDVDGNSFTERFPKLLRTGSLIFKSTKHTEWFSERLQPFVDYVPVSYDQTDLEEKVEWAHAHQSLAQFIAKHGKETSERLIRPEDQQCYTYRLILEYHSLFDSSTSS